MSYFKIGDRTWYVLPSGRMATSEGWSPDLTDWFRFVTQRGRAARTRGEQRCADSHEYLDVIPVCDTCKATV